MHRALSAGYESDALRTLLAKYWQSSGFAFFFTLVLVNSMVLFICMYCQAWCLGRLVKSGSNRDASSACCVGCWDFHPSYTLARRFLLTSYRVIASPTCITTAVARSPRVI